MKITYGELEDRVRDVLKKGKNIIEIPRFSDMSAITSLPFISSEHLFWVIGRGSLLPQQVNKAIIGAGCAFAEKQNEKDHGRRYIKNSISQSGLIAGKDTLLTVENSTVDSLWADGAKLFGAVCNTLVAKKALVSSSIINAVNVKDRLSLLTLSSFLHQSSSAPLIDGDGMLCALPKNLVRSAGEIDLRGYHRVMVHSPGENDFDGVDLSGKNIREARIIAAGVLSNSQKITLDAALNYEPVEDVPDAGGTPSIM